MKKIDWKRKLSSRKFWALVAAVALACGVLFGIDDLQMEQVVALISAIGGIIAYILGESYVDGKNIEPLEGIELETIFEDEEDGKRY